jgi:uridine kinase
MKLLLIEGQPGSGKSTFTSKICNHLEKRNIEFILNDEFKQDTEIFTDFWENNSMNSDIAIQLFLSSWRKYISSNKNDSSIHIFDNSIMNHIQYLMAILTLREEIIEFFKTITKIFLEIDTRMIFLDGNSEIVIRKVDELRKNSWGERVALMLENFKYQQIKNRKGKQGMIEFFHDSQDLKREMLKCWEFPLLNLDITDGKWCDYDRMILNFIQEYHL